MRLRWAIAAGLLAGAAAGWFSLEPGQRPGWTWLGGADPDSAPVPAPLAETPGAAAPSAPPLVYRWRDDAGVVNVSDRPPPDRPYERVEIPLERNVVPLTPPAPPPPEDRPERRD